MIKRIHINQHKLKANLKNGTNDPVITIQTSKGPTYANGVIINGPSKLVYSPNKPLSCGARLWLETESDLVLE